LNSGVPGKKALNAAMFCWEQDAFQTIGFD
jgi:hypothetical protein